MRKIAITLAVVLVVLVAGYAFATGGTPDREPAAFITAGPVAHRGLWTDGPEAPENSYAAFEAAAAAGYAVELDARLSRDGVVVVMHDDDVSRMTGEEGLISQMTLSEIKDLWLGGGEEPVPTLDGVLRMIDGSVPVFVEVKNEGDVGELEVEVARQLSAYEGDVAVMSFNPFSLARIAELAPEVPRGQLASRFKGEDLPWYQKLLLANMTMNWSSKPDFIAYDIDALPCPGVTVQTWRGRPILGWTADTPEERTAAAAYCDAVICNPGALP